MNSILNILPSFAAHNRVRYYRRDKLALGRKVAAFIRDVAAHDVYDMYDDHSRGSPWTPRDVHSYQCQYACLALKGLVVSGKVGELRQDAARHLREVMGWKEYAPLSSVEPTEQYTVRMMAMELAALVAEQEGVS